MRNLIFVVWLLGFIFLTTLDQYWNHPVSNNESSIVLAIFYVLIAIILYEKKPK